MCPTPEAEEEQHKIPNPTILQRIRIAIDVASASEYLNHHCQEPVLHCDVKPSNVLLDSDMVAHVGDFELSRFLPEVSNPNQSSSVGVKGTIGYAAPGNHCSYSVLKIHILLVGNGDEEKTHRPYVRWRL